MNSKQYIYSAAWTFIAASALALTTFAEDQDAKLMKTMDGMTSYCKADSTGQRLVRSKHALVKLNDHKISGEQADVSLEVSIVKCDSGKWTLDGNPTISKYTTTSLATGREVEVTQELKDLEVVVTDDFGKTIARHDLDLQGKSSNTVDLKLDLSKVQGSDVKDMLVVVKAKTVTTTSENKAIDNDMITSFGSFRLRLNAK